MCIILVVPPDKIIKPEWIVRSANNHPDGWGMMWSDGKKLHVYKDQDCSNITSIFKQIEAVRNNFAKSYLILHFRAASYGNISLENTHPILIRNDAAIVHNGSFEIDRESRAESDTVALAKMLSQFTTEQLKSKLVQDLIELICREAQGCVVMMFNDGSFKIFNEYNGREEKGIWFSNNSYTRLWQIVRIRPEKSLYTSDYDTSLCYICKNSLDPAYEQGLCAMCSEKFVHTFNVGRGKKQSETST